MIDVSRTVIYASLPAPQAVATAVAAGLGATVLQTGGLHVILTRLRKPYHLEVDFTQLGLDPRTADIVFVKIGYLEPELDDMAAGWRPALTPGGVDQDLMRLRHRRIRRPMFPFDGADFEPDLRARFIPVSNVPLSGEDC